MGHRHQHRPQEQQDHRSLSLDDIPVPGGSIGHSDQDGFGSIRVPDTNKAMIVALPVEFLAIFATTQAWIFNTNPSCSRTKDPGMALNSSQVLMSLLPQEALQAPQIGTALETP